MRERPPARTPRDLVRAGATACGDRPALISGEERLTYRQLAVRTREAAGALARAGVGPGVQVALMLPNSIDHVVWYYGVLEAGGIAMPCAPTLAAAEARALLDAAGPRLLATLPASSLPGELGVPLARASAPGHTVALWRIDRAPLLRDAPRGAMLRHWSSGSTGRPKHLLKTEANVAADLAAITSALELDEEDVFLAVAPFHTQHGAKAFTVPFSVGACASVLPRFLPGAVLDAVRRDRVTVMPLATPMLEALASCRLRPGEERTFSGLRYCLTGGSLLRREAHRAFRARFGVPPRAVYGATETMRVSIDLDDDFEEGRCGRPLPGVEVGIFDEEGSLLPPGTIGRIGVRSPACSAGYLAEPEATARVFCGRTVFPGDRGYLDRGGRLHVLGRDDILNLGGQKVDPLEVERVIRAALPVREVIVVGDQHAGLPTIAVFLEADPDRVTSSMVRDACRAKLSLHKIPTRIEIRQRLARDAMGKVSRPSLRGEEPRG